MEVPLISVIVPVYKVEPYIAHCLNNLKEQTYTNWECIVVNDGTPDKSMEIAREIGGGGTTALSL